MSDDKDVRISNEGQAEGHERLTGPELLRQGGEWLGAARQWLRWHTRNGDRVTWGSGDLIEPQLSVRQIEDLAAEVAAAAMRPQPNEERLSQALKARWKAEGELVALRRESPPPDPLFGDGSPWREAAKKAGISADKSPDTVTPGAELLAVVRRHAWRHPELRDAVQDFDRRSWRPQVYESFGCPHADSDSHWYEYSNKLTQDVLQVVEDLPSDWTSRTGVGGRLQLYAEKLLDELRAARDVVDDARKFGRCEGACVTCAQMGEACGSRELNLSLKGYDMAARVRSSDSSCDLKVKP